MALGAMGASAASAVPAAWWQLTSGSRPSPITPGSRRSEVQEVEVEPAAGETSAAFELAVGSQDLGTFATEPLAAKENIQVASPANIQVALEEAYGVGNVAVTGGPVGTAPLTIASVNGAADQIIHPVDVHSVGFGIPRAKVVTSGHPDGELVVTAENLGPSTVNAASEPVKITDVLPAGVTALGISAWKTGEGGIANVLKQVPCSLEDLTCTVSTSIPSFEQIEVRIAVSVEPGIAPASTINKVTITGGAVNPARLERPIALGAGSTPFGVQEYRLTAEGEDGTPETQAGAHPFQVSTILDFSQEADHAGLGEKLDVQPVGSPKDTNLRWPAGLIGSTTAVPQCPLAAFFTVSELAEEDECPPQTAVGVALVTVDAPGSIGSLIFPVPVFNLEPKPGEPARVGFYLTISHSPVVIDSSVRTGSDYGITVSSRNITQTAGILSAHVTIWGVPGDQRHDNARGYGCIAAAREAEYPHAPCNPLEDKQPAPFLSMPTACVGPLTSLGDADSWTEPGVLAPFAPDGPMAELDGCGLLPFQPALTVTPEKSGAGEPTGLTVDAHLAQDSSKSAGGLISSALRDMTVELPAGVTINPAAANGLQACSEAQIGFLPLEGGPGDLRFTPGIPTPSCPDAAKIGTVTITTPVLAHPLEGSVYLAAQDANPFGSLLAIYVIAEDPVTGTLVKLAGKVTLDETTGQISTSFEGTPDVPLEDARFDFFGGQRAALVTPPRCGSYAAEGLATPWSGTPSVHLTASFSVTSGPNGGPCPAAIPFAPALIAGTTNNSAASFSPLTTSISRGDGEQHINSVQLHLPAGLAGVIAGIPRCPEAQANAGTCSPASLVGHTTPSIGVGREPFTVTGGQVFLTEGYRGAPFGLSIVTPAVAGPFNLGNVIVRAKIEIDPSTAALTITTDEIPHILKGIPLDIQHVNVAVDRRGFTFNPTNCSAMAITGTVGSVEGASAAVSVAFQVANCAVLKFAPKFSVSTSGKASKAGGASLDVRVAANGGPQPGGGEANIRSVKVALPKQLPSRLTTLQKACLAAVFEANPAACPKESDVGTATAKTPILTNPLTGPAYLVSHGGAAFPDLEIVLQGEGIKLVLDGHTNIKHGITTSTFNTVPDAPISSFELKLPTGPFSVLGAYVAGSNHYKLCGQSLTLPTTITAQNGAVIAQTTKLGVTGCPKAKTRAQKLTAAMKVCHKKAKGKRAGCEKQARKKYGPLKKK